MKIIVLLFLLSICITGHSQLKFHSQNYVGLLEGNQRAAFQIQSINGLQKGRFFGGLGTGLDYYFLRSVPLFLSFTGYITPENRSFFVTLDGGWNFVWAKTTGNLYNGYRTDGDFKPSLYFGASAGYKISLKNQKDAILLNIGYSAKHLKEKINSGTQCLFPPCPDYHEGYDYKFNRLSLRVGWMF